MSKYDYQFETKPYDINAVLAEGETIIWEGKPKKSAYIINRSIKMLPVALIWILFDGAFIGGLVGSGAIKEMWYFIIPFFALHLMPVWIWLGNVITSGQHWKNTAYAVTDRRIIMHSGFVNMEYESLSYKDIVNVKLRIGVIDKMLGVGDLYFDSGEDGGYCFLDIENAKELYPKIQKVVMDIQTDIAYPNDLRPDENHGYNTKYVGM